MKDGTPWYRSLTVGGVVSGTLTFLLSPEVLNVLPAPWAKAVGIASAAAAVIGLRRSVPPVLFTPPTVTPRGGDANVWAMTFDANGVNPYGETIEQVTERVALMRSAAEGANLHRVPAPQGGRKPE